MAELVVSRRPMELQVTGKALRVHFGDVTAWCQLVEGNFPNYTQLIPTGHKSRVTLVADEMVRAVKTVRGMARDGSGIVRLRYEPGRLTVSAVAAEEGEVETTAPIQLEGEAGHIALSSGNLLDYLKGREGVLVVELNNPTSPAVFIHRGERVVVMPMHVQWGDAPKEQPQEGVAETPSEPAPAGDEPTEEMDDEATRMEEPTSGEPAAPQPESEAPKAPRRGRKRKTPTDPAP